MRYRNTLWSLLLAIPLVALPACENLPGNKRTQGAVAGGVAGGVAGAAMSDKPLLGALIGAAAGGAGGYIIGAEMEKADADPQDKQAAQQSIERARQSPATAADVRGSDTADLNHDGFVTTDEVIAMENAGLTDDEMMDRLQATDQIFELSSADRTYLRKHGVSDYVISQMENVNREERERYISGRISRPK